MRLPRFKLTYANVVATIALFMALGGVSYAAAVLPKDSVGTEQIRREAVRTGKLADEAVTAAKLGHGVRERLAAGEAQGPAPEKVKYAETAGRAEAADKATAAEEAETAAHADEADEATHAGDADELGGQPASRYLTADAVLASGETEIGDFAASAPTGSYGSALIQFWPHLPETLQENHIKVIGPGGPYSSECPAPGQAEPTYMCVYQSWNYNMSFESFTSSTPGSQYAGPISGVMLWAGLATSGNVRGSWAYTAP